MVCSCREKNYQTVTEAAIDAKISMFQYISMEPTEKIVEYTNRRDAVVSELASIVQTINSLEKRRALLQGLTPDFALPAQFIRSNRKGYTDSVSYLVVFECTVDRPVTSVHKAFDTRAQPGGRSLD